MSIFNKLINVRLNKLTFKKIDINPGKFYSTNGVIIDPMWVTGFVDAEGCFSGPRSGHVYNKLFPEGQITYYKLL
jgi:hypothetical protein